MYKCNHFSIQELVGPEVYKDRGAKAWELLDNRLLKTIDQLRERFGECVINNWSFGGGYSESGLRTPASKHYRPYSQHTFGRAADCKFKVDVEIIRQYILSNPDVFEFINFVELDTPGWLHIDVRNTKRIATWSPVNG
jgi:hypothetical protein